MWEALWEVLVVEHTMEGGAPVVEPLREEEEEEEGGKGVEEDWRGSSSTSGLALLWAPAPEWVMPMGPWF